MTTTAPSTFGRASFIRVHRAAEIMSLSARTIRSYCESGAIPAQRVGRHWLIPVVYIRSLTLR